MMADEPKASESEIVTHESPVLQDRKIDEIGQRYGITIDPENATQYKLVQVIHTLEMKLKEGK